MLFVYVFDEARDRVVIVTIHDARTSSADRRVPRTGCLSNSRLSQGAVLADSFSRVAASGSRPTADG
jgi:hypothetical protein